MGCFFVSINRGQTMPIVLRIPALVRVIEWLRRKLRKKGE